MESLQLDGRDYNQTGEITTVTWRQDGRVYNQRYLKSVAPSTNVAETGEITTRTGEITTNKGFLMGLV